nr:glycosyl hydrolase family 28-related protein [uncultured Dethiosulfovibrio sp.]
MSTQQGRVKVMRGAEVNRQTVTPNAGELIATTDLKEVYLGDGVTPGGVRVNPYNVVKAAANQTDPTVVGSLSWWITRMAGNDGTVLIMDPLSVTSDYTVPENICLKFEKGGKVVVAEGVTLTINGSIEAGLWHIFDGLGTVTGNPKIEFIYPEWFGAVGNGAFDDSPAFQKAVSWSSSAVSRIQTPPISGDAAWPHFGVYLSKKTYYLNTPVDSNTYMRLIGRGSIITCPEDGTMFVSGATYNHSSPQLNDDPGLGRAYRVLFEDVTFVGENVEAVHFNARNMDNARFQFDRCIFRCYTETNKKYTILIRSQSSRVVFNNCDVPASPNFLFTSVDFTHLTGGWFNGHGHGLIRQSTYVDNNNNGTAFITHGPDSRHMFIKDCVFIPEKDGSGVRDFLRWIDNYGHSIIIKDCHFGGENSGFPIIYQYRDGRFSIGNTSTANITIEDTQLAAGPLHTEKGVVVLMNGVLPGKYTFSGCQGLRDAPLVSSAGWDLARTKTDGTTTYTDSLLEAVVNSEGSSTTDPIRRWKVGGCSIIEKTCGIWGGGVPDSLKPFYRNLDSERRLAGTPFHKVISSPSKETEYELFKVLLIEIINSGHMQRSISFRLNVCVSASTPGVHTNSEYVSYNTQVLWNGALDPIVKVEKIDTLSCFTGYPSEQPSYIEGITVERRDLGAYTAFKIKLRADGTDIYEPKGIAVSITDVCSFSGNIIM